MYASLCVVQISPGLGDGKDEKWEEVVGGSQEQAVPVEYQSLHKKVFMRWVLKKIQNYDRKYNH